jgi:hypothetical protein
MTAPPIEWQIMTDRIVTTAERGRLAWTVRTFCPSDGSCPDESKEDARPSKLA